MGLSLPTPIVQQVQAINSVSYANQWILLPITGLSPKAQNTAHRLNGLGSSYYFGKVILRKTRFKEYLHKEWCELIEQDLLKEVIEIPRDHFKSTIFSELAPMWWALPFTQEDEDLMKMLGYDDRWIKWMKRAHDQDTRTLLVSENLKNACKLGRRIDKHYKENDFFRKLYPEIIPDGTCMWSVETMTQKRTNKGSAFQGEGTFDYLGVDGALQSRHYNRCIQDDLIGKEALNSTLVMESSIEYHKLLVGAFDADPTRPESDNDEIVVGNRWSYRDLNYHIRKHEQRFRITNHSALGGCCSKHPIGQPIFPDEFSANKLNGWKERLGSYLFSCQFLNRPTPPGENKFKTVWLNHYKFKIDHSIVHKKVRFKENGFPEHINEQRHLQRNGSFTPAIQRYVADRDDSTPDDVHSVMIEHLVKTEDGAITYPDLYPGALRRHMICDPNHAGEEGRSRNALCVTGTNYNSNVYLLECYAEFSGHYEYVNKIFTTAEKWKMRDVWLEVVGAQRWLKFYLDTEMANRRSLGKWTFDIQPLKTDSGKNAKIQRIESLENVFAKGIFWIPAHGANGADKFLAEYDEYPFAPTKDILDVLGYGQEMWNIEYMNDKDVNALFQDSKNTFNLRPASSTGY